MKISYHETGAECVEALAALIADVAAEAVERRGVFSLVLSGGSTPVALHQKLASVSFRGKIDWSKALIFFGDERSVPPDSELSNYRMAKETLLDPLSIPDSRVYRVLGELSAQKAAENYQEVVRSHLEKWGGFDICLLGLGPDGHTASLFPGGGIPNGAELVISVAAPTHISPAVERVTFTPSAIESSSHICFLSGGPKKEAVLKTIFQSEHCELPAARFRNTATWFLYDLPFEVR